MLSTVACSSTTRLSSANMCKAAGGTYSQGTCQPGGSRLTAQKMCEAHGGTYFSGGDYCEVGGTGSEADAAARRPAGASRPSGRGDVPGRFEPKLGQPG